MQQEIVVLLCRVWFLRAEARLKMMFFYDKSNTVGVYLMRMRDVFVGRFSQYKRAVIYGTSRGVAINCVLMCSHLTHYLAS